MIEDTDHERLRHVLHAVWDMKRLDIKGIQAAYAQSEVKSPS
jgi:hypothetical protein